MYYRWHSHTAPEFTADNAWSAPWGVTFTPDGDEYKCVACDGTGEDTTDPTCGACRGAGCRRCDDTGNSDLCLSCRGEGTLECDRGYSAVTSPDDLADYMAGHSPLDPLALDREGTVCVFEGDQVGYGLEMEPLVVPTRVVETLTWSEFTRKHIH